MRRLQAAITILLLAASFAQSQTPALAHPLDQGTVPDPQVEALFGQMSPEQRVGQLFLVTYYGPDAGPDSDVASLISEYHVGGVVLTAANENFTDAGPVADQIYQASTSMQTLAAASETGGGTDTPDATAVPGPYVPLFVGMQQDGILPATGSLETGLSPVPSSMAVGATWDPNYSEKAGQVVGEELSSLGVNFLLGTSADVVEVPQPYTQGDLGVSVFGGQPFWVSRMVAAYVRGVHEGSDQRMAVVVGHFPGHGGADRLATVEVPIVRKSLDQLTQFDLIPFFAITGNAANALEMTDGVLTGHISYRGFQGDNPRVATRPISLDAQALQVLLKLDSIAKWRTEGGLVVSDSLGMRGVKRFYDPQETSFNNRRIAQDALLAGNDILYVDQFGSNPPENQASTIEDTINFFVQLYQADPAFQARVDDAVHRILAKKLELYGSFNLEQNVMPPVRSQDMTGKHMDIAFSVAQNAATLLSPNKPDLLTSPQSGDRIVIFTDTRPLQLCSTCASQPTIPVDALQSGILRLYGPQASAQVRLESIQSFSFEQLSTFLQHGPATTVDGATPEPDSLEIALANTDWIVFVMQNVDTTVPSSDAVKQFLGAPSIAPHAQVVVMSTKAPYYLDSTEISKLAAYYGIYSSSQPFIDVAVRALFLGAPPVGASPVSVSGTNYSILDATSPDPNQVIKLLIQTPTTPDGNATVAEYVKGGTLPLVTGPILDVNGHPVPDGTQVEFVQNYSTEGLRTSNSVSTVGGVAVTTLTLARTGEVAVTAQSGLAHQSDTLRVSVSESGVTVTVEPPNVASSEPSGNLTPSPGPGVTPTKTQNPIRQPRVNFGDWFLSLLGLSALCVSTFWYGYRSRDMNQGLLLALPMMVFGLSGYNYYALRLPGAGLWNTWFHDWAAGLATWLTAVIGLVLTTVALGGRLPLPPPIFRRRNRRG